MVAGGTATTPLRGVRIHDRKAGDTRREKQQVLLTDALRTCYRYCYDAALAAGTVAMAAASTSPGCFE